MDQKQLMVGDWVKLNVEGQSKPEIVQVSAFQIKEWYKDIDPIPLTSDIIEKNGFHHNGLVYIYSNTNLYLYQETGNIWEFGLFDEYGNGKGDPSSMKFCKIKYVHELQHILNLKFVDVEFVI